MCNLSLKANWERPQRQPPKRKLWKLRDPLVRADFMESVTRELQTQSDVEQSTEQTWTRLKNALLNATDSACGWTKGGARRPRETWWWNYDVASAIKHKRTLWKTWRMTRDSADKERYQVAKRKAKAAVYQAKKAAETTKIQNLERKDGKNYIFKLAKKLKSENRDIVQECCVKNSDGSLTTNEDERQQVCKAHYERLLNVEFPWSTDALEDLDPVEGPAPNITVEMVLSAITAMKRNKAAGPSGIVTEMIRAAGFTAAEEIMKLGNSIIREGKIPQEWTLSTIINCFKGKGDSLNCNNYRGLKMLDHVLKIIERVIDSFIRDQVTIDPMQFRLHARKRHDGRYLHRASASRKIPLKEERDLLRLCRHGKGIRQVSQESNMVGYEKGRHRGVVDSGSSGYTCTRARDQAVA